jgi:hypothetical protein
MFLRSPSRHELFQTHPSSRYFTIPSRSYT